jgi:hypothetical protein
LPISATTLLFVYNGSIVIIVRDERVFDCSGHGDYIVSLLWTLISNPEM